MKIEIEWGNFIELKIDPPPKRGRPPKDHSYVDLKNEDDWDAIPREPGVYVFAKCSKKRKEDRDEYIPLYIGETSNIYRRINEQLTKPDHQHRNRMKYIADRDKSGSGRRVLVVGKMIKPKTSTEEVRQIAEQALIHKVVSDGNSLWLNNIKMTREKVDSITFTKNIDALYLFSRQIDIFQKLRPKQ